jgi:RNA polymerase sigma-70 factor (ECF subfamily)
MPSPYNELSDFELTAMIGQDDHDAYRELYYRYTEALYTHAYMRLNDREEAKDVVQDVFSTLWSKRAEINIQQNIAGYLYISVRNRILNLYALEKRRSAVATSLAAYMQQENTGAEADTTVRLKQLQILVEREVAQMPPKMRAVFELSRKQHMTHKEISRQLGISEKTVKNHVNAALKVLRSRLGIVNYLTFLFL